MARIFYLDNHVNTYLKEKEEDVEEKKETSFYMGRFDKEGKLERIVRVTPSGLEAVISKHFKPKTGKDLITHIKYYDKYFKDRKKEAYLQPENSEVIEVDYLGGGDGWQILGMYVPSEDKAYVLRHLDPKTKEYVKAHELSHRRRQYSGETQNERSVDAETEHKVGYKMRDAA